jgi:hypothetical protein
MGNEQLSNFETTTQNTNTPVPKDVAAPVDFSQLVALMSQMQAAAVQEAPAPVQAPAPPAAPAISSNDLAALMTQAMSTPEKEGVLGPAWKAAKPPLALAGKVALCTAAGILTAVAIGGILYLAFGDRLFNTGMSVE